MVIELIGGDSEIKELEDLREFEQAEFLAVYGRRRVGKTFLITHFFGEAKGVFFAVTGLKDGTRSEQLDVFHKAFLEAFDPKFNLQSPKNWMQAFEQLTVAIENVPRNRRIVLFFDELPWLATPKSKLVQALDHYWNTRWSRRKKLLLIACGSAASWMLDNLINATGGLYNRVTRVFHLQPLTLKETQEFLAARSMKLAPAQVLQVYLALGGIPYYLNQLSKEESIARNVNRLCFQENGLLIDEFDRLFASLFKHHEEHAELIRVIANHAEGLTRPRILAMAKKASKGGRLTKRLDELKSAGFLAAYKPYGRSEREMFYKVVDPYSLFYLSWIESFKDKFFTAAPRGKFWESQFSSQRYRIWCGYAFETVCLRHVDIILDFVDVAHLVTAMAPWRCGPVEGGGRGAQIDLVIERSDDVITICEIKCHQELFVLDKTYAEEVQAKIDALRNATGTKKTIEVLFITVHGMKHNKYTAALNSRAMEIADFF